MSVDLETERDLSLIFERDDVKEAFAGHCAKTHNDIDLTRDCPYCRALRTCLAFAISEWLGIVDQDRALRLKAHA